MSKRGVVWLFRPIPQVLSPDIRVCCIWIRSENVVVSKKRVMVVRRRVIGSKRVDLGGNAWSWQSVHPLLVLRSLKKARGRQRGRTRVLNNHKQTLGSRH